MMPIGCEPTDYEWLTSEQAQHWLALAATDGVALHRKTAQLRQALTAARTHLVLHQIELRMRAKDKFRAADRLYFTAIGLEQATDAWVARYKARRFRAGNLVADLCCGIGGDLMGLAATGPVIAVDRDQQTAHFARVNLQQISEAFTTNIQVECRAVEGIDVSQFSAWHIDPDRRGHARRTVDLAWMIPDLTTLKLLLRQNQNGAIKLAPATKLPLQWRTRAELEWISRERQCRQLVVWFGSLAEKPGTRRATVLANDGSVCGRIEGQVNRLPDAAAGIGEFVYEPDAAVLAAGLAGQVAQQFGLEPLATNIPYFTSNRSVHDGALAAFRVKSVMPFDARRLGSELRAHRIGQVEIKHRGVRIAPEKLRRNLKLRGDQAGIVIIAPHGERVLAILGQRHHQQDPACPAPEG